MFGIKRVLIKVGSLILIAVLVIPIGAIYRLNIEKWAEEKGLDKAYKSGLGLLMESKLGLVLLALLFVVIGVALTLWIEDWLKKRNAPDLETEECFVELEYFENTEMFGLLRNELTKNFKKSWRRGRPDDFDVFILFETPITRPIALVSSNFGEGTWSETHSSEEFIFINFKNTNREDNIFVNIYSSDDNKPKPTLKP